MITKDFTSSVKILDGKWLSEQFEISIASKVKEQVAIGKRRPGLGVILVGDNPASLAYVGRKEKVAKRCGFITKEARLPSNVESSELEKQIDLCNKDPEIDGILLQLPLPKHLDSEKMIDLISPNKDADGLHPLNQGLLMRGEGKLRPCTPSGVMKLIDLALLDPFPINSDLSFDPIKSLKESDLSGKNAVVVGRSILVGKAVALMLLERNATVTIAHSKTKNLIETVQQSDIVVAAVGRPELIKGDWIRDGAIVVDVGINRTDSGSLVGDVDYNGCLKNAAAITPVPGGVGPMTVIMLMKNTLEASLNN